MPINAAEKSKLDEILAKVDSTELVRIAGCIYDCVLLADLSMEKLSAIGKFIWAKVPWSRLPPGLNDARYKLVVSAETNFIRRLTECLTVVEDDAGESAEEAPPVEQPAPPKEDPSRTEAAATTQPAAVQGDGIRISDGEDVEDTDGRTDLPEEDQKPDPLEAQGDGAPTEDDAEDEEEDGEESEENEEAPANEPTEETNEGNGGAQPIDEEHPVPSETRTEDAPAAAREEIGTKNPETTTA